MCENKLKTTQQSCTRGKLGLRIVSLMIHVNCLGAAALVEISQCPRSKAQS